MAGQHSRWLGQAASLGCCGHAASVWQPAPPPPTASGKPIFGFCFSYKHSRISRDLSPCLQLRVQPLQPRTALMKAWPYSHWGETRALWKHVYVDFSMVLKHAWGQWLTSPDRTCTVNREVLSFLDRQEALSQYWLIHCLAFKFYF